MKIVVFLERQENQNICLVEKTSIKMGEREIIQVTWDMNDPKTAEREQRALKAAEIELGIKGRILTSRDYAIHQVNQNQN